MPKTGGIGNTYYIWDPKLNNGTTNLGGYQTFSSTNDYLPTVAGGSYSGANTRIESGQAFFVFASGSAGTIQMVEAAKAGGTSVNAFRPLPKESAVTVKLSAEVQGTLFTADASTVVFDNRFTDAVNSDDARKLLNPGENIASVTDQQLFAVEARSSIRQQQEIQYHVSNLRQQSYQLQINCRNIQEQGVELYLEDKYMNRQIPVTGGSPFIYSFSVTADAGSKDAKRFRLLIGKKQDASGQEGAAYITVNPNPAEAARFNLNVYGIAGGEYKLSLTDQKGAVLYYEKISLLPGQSSSVIQLNNKPAGGIYQVELSDGKHSRYLTRIVFK